MRILAPCLLALALALGGPLAAQSERPAPPRAPQGFRTYQGQWFDVFYPSGWKAMAAPQSRLPENESDGVFFTAPDAKARFYVFSPLWNGTPGDVLHQRGETVVARRIQKSSDTLKSDIVTTWYTVRGPRNAYTRSVVDVENKTLNIRRTFAYQYADAATYRRYAPLYARFKASLRQYSD